MVTSTLAFDRSSVRMEDKDGHLHVMMSPISKATVSPYLGKEIPGWEKLGLNPERLYRMLRDPQELAKAAPTFAEKPLLYVHKAFNAHTHDHQKVIGTTGTHPVFEDPYLKTSLTIWDGVYINAVREGRQKELSASYYYDPVMTPGEYQGQKYDGIMTNIIGNHVALVERGRAGADVAVADAALDINMEQNTLKQEAEPLILGMLAAVYKLTAGAPSQAPILDELRDFAASVASQPWDIVQEEIRNFLHIYCAESLSDEDITSLLDTLADIVQPEQTSAEPTPDGGIADVRRYLAERFQALREAERAVRPLVGEIQTSLDSAEAVYAFALRSVGISTAGIHPSAYPTLLDMAKKMKNLPSGSLGAGAIAAQSMADRFGANRIRRL